MKNKKLILTMVFFVILGISAFAGGSTDESNTKTEDLPQIVIRNNTGYEIVHYKLRYKLIHEWQFSGDVVLKDGHAAIINLPYPLEGQSKDPNYIQPPTDYYDIQLIDIDGDVYTKYLVRISTNAQVIDFTINDIGYDDNFRPPALPGYY
jgi:hypothetical protein